LKFNTDYLKKIAEVVPQKSEDLHELTAIQYADLFKNHPFQEKDHQSKIFRNILKDSKLRNIFDLN
jgi:hypothetical protein